jgi:hypothetical protein
MPNTSSPKPTPQTTNNKPKHARNLPFFIMTLIIMVLVVIAFVFINEQTHQRPTDDHHNMQAMIKNIASKKRSDDNTQKIENNIGKVIQTTTIDAETLNTLSHINQATFSVQLSYYAISNEQNTASASAWLKLAMQQIKQAQISNDMGTDILQQLAELRKEILNIESMPTQSKQNTLNELQNKVDQLQQPKIATITQEIEQNTPQASEQESAYAVIKWLMSYCQHLWTAVINRIQQSISIERIDHDTFHTLHHTASQPFFYELTKQLIQQASLAASYHNQTDFNYACAQLKSIITFHVLNQNDQQTLLTLLQQLQATPVRIVPPNYLPVLSSLNQASNTVPEIAPPTTKPAIVSSEKPQEKPEKNTVEQPYLTVESAKT